MSALNKNNLPRVNEELYYQDSVSGRVVTIVIAVSEVDGEYEIWHRRKDGGLIDGTKRTAVDPLAALTAITSPAEKRREEQSTLILQTLMVAGVDTDLNTAYQLYDTGMRVLGPNSPEV